MYTKLNSLISSINNEYENYSDAQSSSNDCPLYRGMRYIGDNVILSPELRTSAYSNNVYTCLLSEILPSWKDYPKRNHSIICTNYKEKALDYTKNGEADKKALYQLFPENGTMLAVCPADDLWLSFDYLSNTIYNDTDFTLDQFNESFLRFLCEMAIEIKEKRNHQMFKTPDKLQSMFKKYDTTTIFNVFNVVENYVMQLDITDTEIDYICRQYDGFTCNSRMFEYLILHIKKGHKIIDILDYIFNPDKNGFKLIPFKQLSSINNNNSHEIWFDNKCLAIKTR